jgi:hypothetical protein
MIFHLKILKYSSTYSKVFYNSILYTMKPESIPIKSCFKISSIKILFWDSWNLKG